MDKKSNNTSKNTVSRETKHTVFLITYSIVLAVALLNMNSTMSLLGWLLSIASPFLTGLIVAFVINIIMTRLETKVFIFLDKPNYKLWQKIKRPVCMFLSFLIIVLSFAAIIGFIAPQISQSIQMLSANMPIYSSFLQNFTNNILGWFNLSIEDFGSFLISWDSLFEKFSSLIANISPSVLNFATGFTSAIFDFFMGIIFAIYLLLGKEKILKNIDRATQAYLPNDKYSSVKRISNKANFIFTSFVVGQLTDAVILGVMYFIGTSVFRMPYAPLIATIMAIASLIPIFGPIIGAIPSAFILLMVNPSLAIIFIIMAIVFQQIESNIIYPKVVGDSVGLPGVWVLFAILVGGSLFGALGMVLSVPFASLIYSLLREDVNARINSRKIAETKDSE